MKLILLGLFVLSGNPLMAQGTAFAQITLNEYTSFVERTEGSMNEPLVELSDQSFRDINKPDASDSLIARRRFLTTVFYRNGKKLANTTVIRNFLSNQKSVNQFQWGHVLNPIGPLISLSGLAIGYLAFKGNTASAYITGVRTPTNPYPADIPVEYTEHSLTKLVAGLGLFVGGICLIEISNELIRKPANTYNSTLRRPTKVTFLRQVRVEITPRGNLALLGRF